jgi:hypothetical protein
MNVNPWSAEHRFVVRYKERMRTLVYGLIKGRRYTPQCAPALPVGRWMLPLQPRLRRAELRKCCNWSMMNCLLLLPK